MFHTLKLGCWSQTQTPPHRCPGVRHSQPSSLRPQTHQACLTPAHTHAQTGTKKSTVKKGERTLETKAL